MKTVIPCLFRNLLSIGNYFIALTGQLVMSALSHSKGGTEAGLLQYLKNNIVHFNYDKKK